MWYCYKKHICNKCGETMTYSQDTMTLFHGIKCPKCGQEYKFNVTIPIIKEEDDD